MNSRLVAIKEQRISVAHEKAVKLLNRHANKTKSGVITFPEARRILAWLYHFNRRESRLFLKELINMGLAELRPFHGIKILDGGLGR